MLQHATLILVLHHVIEAFASPTPIRAMNNNDGSDDFTTQFRYRLKSPTKFAEPAELTESSRIVRLNPTRSRGGSSIALHNSIKAKNGSSYTALQAANSGASYNVEIDFGDQSFSVLFDTGSSDLWIAHETVRCVNYFGVSFPVEQCGFGPLYQGNFEEGVVENENFNITYGDGEFLTGDFGYQDVTLAGIEVKKQQAALVDYAYWLGDNKTSGLMGFGYPALTSAFPGDDPKKDNSNKTIEYPNWITSAINRKLLKSPSFSVAMERSPNGGGGYLAIGGLPPVGFEKEFTSTPIKILKLSTRSPQRFSKEYSYYTIIPDGFKVRSRGVESYFSFAELAASDTSSGSASPSPAPYGNGSSGGEDDEDVIDTNFPVIIDTGTTLNYLPSKLVEHIASLYSPPAVYSWDSGLYEALCDAEPPEIAVVINGTEFEISPQDALLKGELGFDPYTGFCIIGFQESYRGPWILGDVFLKNVVAVFDIGAAEMRFAKHINYTE